LNFAGEFTILLRNYCNPLFFPAIIICSLLDLLHAGKIRLLAHWKKVECTLAPYV